MLERHPFTAEPTEYDEYVWIEIVAGTVRWVQFSILTQDMFFHVPDARIWPDFPQVTVAPGSEHWVPVLDPDRPIPVPLNQEFSRFVANHLNSLPGTVGNPRQWYINLSVETVPASACWKLSIDEFEAWSDPDNLFSQGDCYEAEVWNDPEHPFSQWDCYQTLAKALLAMPMSTDK